MLLNDDYNSKDVAIHETGHAGNLEDRFDNVKTAMYRGWPAGNPSLLLDQVDISQWTLPLATPTPMPTTTPEVQRVYLPCVQR
jgi:hypothetical protein